VSGRRLSVGWEEHTSAAAAAPFPRRLIRSTTIPRGVVRFLKTRFFKNDETPERKNGRPSEEDNSIFTGKRVSPPNDDARVCVVYFLLSSDVRASV